MKQISLALENFKKKYYRINTWGYLVYPGKLAPTRNVKFFLRIV